MAQLEPTGLNERGMAIRLAHAVGLSGEVTTLSVVTFDGFSTSGVLRGTTTSQHWGTLVPPPATGCSCWPHPRPGASSPVWTWKSWLPVPSA